MGTREQVVVCHNKMRHCGAILVILGVTLALSSSAATAQTGPPFNLFDLFEGSPPDEEYEIPPPDEEFTAPPVIRKRGSTAHAAGKTVFDLFPPNRKRSTSVVPTTKPRTASKQGVKNTSGPKGAGVTKIANEKKRLRALAVRLERQRQAQEAEAHRLKAEADQQKQNRKRLLRGSLALNDVRKSPPSGKSTESPSPPAPSMNSLDKTHVARAESIQPLTGSPGKPGPESIKCKKAKSIIEGFAFSNVEAKACEGETYLFSATRNNSNFSIKINSQTWGLTEVSKLKQNPPN